MGVAMGDAVSVLYSFSNASAKPVPELSLLRSALLQRRLLFLASSGVDAHAGKADQPSGCYR
jgi:hypothetical protein